jgi:hypothetical protein
MDDIKKLTSEKLSEIALAWRQPLLDYGWRVDYERVGICDARGFVSIVELRDVVQAFEDAGSFDGPAPERPPGSLLRELTAEDRAEIAAQPIEDLVDAEGLEFLKSEGISIQEFRQAIRDGVIGPKVERWIPAEAMKDALDSLEIHIDTELWCSMVRFRKAHQGASFKQCQGELIRSGAIKPEWGIPEQQWRHYWQRLENEPPYN